MLRRHLEKRGVDLNACGYRMVAHGPILDETDE